jgi:hypothetical protein
VLHLLTEIRNTLQQVEKKYKPVDSEFQIEQITDIGQLGEVEDSLTTEESRKVFNVTLCGCVYMSLLPVVTQMLQYNLFCAI